MFMLFIPKNEDTGWEMLDGILLRGRIKNGMATIVFEGYEFSGTPGSDTLMFTLPQRYWPSAGIYFSVFSNSTEPVAYGCRIQLTGGIRSYIRGTRDSVVGIVTYPVR